MPNTYTHLLYHIVFATKNRQPLFPEEWHDRTFAYMGGIVREQRGVLLAAGGMPDHVHLLVRLPADSNLATVLRLIKTNSSRWLHRASPDLSRFGWQVGYSAFTVSQSAADNVKQYLHRQKEHHQRRTYRDELLKLLRRHEIEFEERYVFE
jgi:putative transposase